MLCSQHPTTSAHVPPGTAEGRIQGRWILRRTALALVVLLVDANVAPAACAGSAARCHGASAFFPEHTYRDGVSETRRRDVDQNQGPPCQDLATAVGFQPSRRQLFLLTGVLRI